MKDERKYTYVSTVAYQGEFDYIFYLDFFPRNYVIMQA